MSAPEGTDRGAAERRFQLVLAAAAEPVSIDTLAASGLWSAGALFELVDVARRDGLVVADPSGPGRLRWADEDGRTRAVLAATEEDLAAALAAPPLAGVLLEGARAARRARDFPRAAALHRALAGVADPGALPGGVPTWLGVVLDSIRLLRSNATLAPATLDAALAAAEAAGDLPTQAVLLAARGLQWLAIDPERARALHERATEAAEASGDPAIRTEVRTYIAVSLVFAGRLREGVATFEAMLGDVPGDLLEPGRGVQLDLAGATPASALAVLAYAFVSLGDHPRALDLLDRMAARGAETGNAALQAQGRLFIAFTRFIQGRPALARADADAAHAYWSPGAEPMYAWFAAVTLAAVRASDGDPAEARRLLEASLPAWRASGTPFIGGSRTLALLEDLEAQGLAPLDGLGLDGEIARLAQSPHPETVGIALRWRARRLLAGEASDAAKAAGDLDRALALLRGGENALELGLTLADAAELAESRGDAEGAARLRAELAERAGPAEGGDGGLDPLRLATAILDLGRLAALPRREGIWGEVAARLCRELHAGRCAIVEERDGGPALLAARGPPAWQEAVLARARAAPPREAVLEAALGAGGEPGSGGRLALVPFADDELGRRGLVALERRDLALGASEREAALLRLLGRQVGILLANVAAWRELEAARQRLEQENRYYREAAPAPAGPIVGGSRAMAEVLALVSRVAQSTTPVLVTGETGVGKELVSREVHLRSPRAAGPFIAVHVAALAPGLVASALFGHERGAFTGATEQAKGRFELADGGTIFLDEIGELSLDDQVRLLRVLQEGTFERVGGTRVIRSDFRLVAATNRDLPAEVRAGRFREDLYFRLAAFPIDVPPLRERPDEIPTLALYFLERAARKLGERFDGITEADLERLLDYPWPGNVRELEHVMERAVLLSQPPRLRIPALEGELRSPRPPPPAPPAREWVTLEEAERRYVLEVLRHTGGKVNGPGGAAELLALKPSTLQFWIDRLGLRRELSRARERRSARVAGPTSAKSAR